MKIYTKSGDDGETGLYDGTRRSKADPVFDVLGTVDELAAHIGLLMYACPSERIFLNYVQTVLLDIGSVVATPLRNKNVEGISDVDIIFIEKEIDRLDTTLKPLKEFLIMNGKTMGAAQAHICRVVCRRAEREMEKHGDIDRVVTRFMNRLSDYFFTLARFESEIEKPKTFLTNFLIFLGFKGY